MIHLLALTALAADLVGADMGGADVTVADGDTLTGVFTNVGRFEVPYGATVTVVPEAALEVHAVTIVVDGRLDAVGAGWPAPWTGSGEGPGGGAFLDAFGSSAGGGGYGGPGGDGRDAEGAAVAGSGGPAYGDPECTESRLGSSGGGQSGWAGAGGGAVWLDATACVEITPFGGVDVSGGDALDEPMPDAGGGGSGGTIRLDAPVVTVHGALAARGGRGQPGQGFYGFPGWGGGGGGGGRVALYGATPVAVFADVLGGDGGSSQGWVGYDEPGFPGGLGTVHVVNPPVVVCVGDPASGDADADGWCATVDCDDADPDTHPTAPELCDGADDNCDGLVDEVAACVPADPPADPTPEKVEEGGGCATVPRGSWGLTLAGLFALRRRAYGRGSSPFRIMSSYVFSPSTLALSIPAVAGPTRSGSASDIPAAWYICQLTCFPATRGK